VPSPIHSNNGASPIFYRDKICPLINVEVRQTKPIFDARLNAATVPTLKKEMCRRLGIALAKLRN
jgi:hypothetical protein